VYCSAQYGLLGYPKLLGRLCKPFAGHFGANPAGGML
jgi:hypothetical protein